MLSARILDGNTTKLRSSGGGKDKSPKKASETGKDSSLSPSGQRQLWMQLRAQQLALVREAEMNWYLKLCHLSSEDTTAYITGMPHRITYLSGVIEFTGTMTMTDGAIPSNYNESNRLSNSPCHLFFFHLEMLPVKKLQKVFPDFQVSFLPTMWPESDISIRDLYVEDMNNVSFCETLLPGQNINWLEQSLKTLHIYYGQEFYGHQ